jgi:predicted aspartyl protease
MCRSFTYTYTGISKYLVTEAEIEYEGNTEKIEALWDTGANITFINDKLINKLSLKPAGNGFTDTLSGEKIPSKYYKVNLTLPNNIEFPDIKVASGETKTCDVLIGMDIISQGDFSISNYKGETKIVYRKPSMGEFSYEPAKGGNVGRNDLCPCGSGRKYKHCCGK